MKADFLIVKFFSIRLNMDRVNSDEKSLKIKLKIFRTALK